MYLRKHENVKNTPFSTFSFFLMGNRQTYLLAVLILLSMDSLTILRVQVLLSQGRLHVEDCFAAPSVLRVGVYVSLLYLSSSLHAYERVYIVGCVIWSACLGLSFYKFFILSGHRKHENDRRISALDRSATAPWWWSVVKCLTG